MTTDSASRLDASTSFPFNVASSATGYVEVSAPEHVEASYPSQVDVSVPTQSEYFNVCFSVIYFMC